jgi:signal transduction histidine kinase
MLLAVAAKADGQATPDDAKAMATKAAEYLKTVGPDKAFPEFDAKDNTTWHDRDLYVTVVDSKGVAVAHGSSPGLIGKPVVDLKDVDGKPFIREMQAIEQVGWVDYKWQDPLTKAVEPKTVYVVRTGDYVVGVGTYKKPQ